MISRKKRFIFISSIFSLILISIILTSCGGNVLRFKNDGKTGNLIDEANGRYYIYCGSYLRAAEIKKAVYARCPKEKGSSEVKLHEIPGIDPAKWLSENIEVGIPLLFREQSEEEPRLEEFETERIHITVGGDITFAIGLIDVKEDIDAMANDYVNGKEVPLPDFIAESYTLNFESEKYKGILYILQYFVDDRGRDYLFDRWTGRCVLCSVDILRNRVDEDITKIETESNELRSFKKEG